MQNQQSASLESQPLSHYREAMNKYGQRVYVPVVDVRDGIAERALAEQIIKSSNQSKFMRYTEYHVSRKAKA